MFETIDEYVATSLREFDGKQLQAVNSNEVDLGDISNEGESLGKLRPPRSAAGSRKAWLKVWRMCAVVNVW